MEGIIINAKKLLKLIIELHVLFFHTNRPILIYTFANATGNGRTF